MVLELLCQLKWYLGQFGKSVVLCGSSKGEVPMPPAPIFVATILSDHLKTGHT